jgi:hypothetical protein
MYLLSPVFLFIIQAVLCSILFLYWLFSSLYCSSVQYLGCSSDVYYSRYVCALTWVFSSIYQLSWLYCPQCCCVCSSFCTLTCILCLLSCNVCTILSNILFLLFIYSVCCFNYSVFSVRYLGCSVYYADCSVSFVLKPHSMNQELLAVIKQLH